MVSTQRGTTSRAGSAWRGFVRRWGWRAYALPILSIVTVAALIQGAPAHHHVVAAQVPAAHRAPAQPAAHPAATHPAGTHSVTTKVQVEGFDATDAGYAPGAAPPAAPAVINLGSDAVSCAQNTYPQLVLVSIKRQHLWACEGAKQVRSTPVTTGASADGDQTPHGSWRVQAKQRDRYLVGPGYKDYVHYWMPFNGDFGLHDAPWQTMPFGSDQWPTRGSHGCVHLPTPMMAWIYSWAKVGTTVVTVES